MQHWIATHREITPTFDPDSETQFTMQPHPVLNGELYSLLPMSLIDKQFN
jgi:hypothetical protein